MYTSTIVFLSKKKKPNKINKLVKNTVNKVSSLVKRWIF